MGSTDVILTSGEENTSGHRDTSQAESYGVLAYEEEVVYHGWVGKDRKLASAAPSSTTPSDQKPGDEKSRAISRPTLVRPFSATKGSFIDKSDLGITNASQILCHTLLGRKQTVPQDSLFRDDIFGVDLPKGRR